mgnify:CR=1 FL=1
MIPLVCALITLSTGQIINPCLITFMEDITWRETTTCEVRFSGTRQNRLYVTSAPCSSVLAEIQEKTSEEANR